LKESSVIMCVDFVVAALAEDCYVSDAIDVLKDVGRSNINYCHSFESNYY